MLVKTHLDRHVSLRPSRLEQHQVIEPHDGDSKGA